MKLKLVWRILPLLALALLLVVGAVLLINANNTLSLTQTATLYDETVRITTVVRYPANWVASTDSGSITLADSQTTLDLLSIPGSERFSGSQAAIVIQRLPQQVVGDLQSPTEVYLAIGQNFITQQSLVGQAYDVQLGGRSTVKLVVETLSGNGYIYIVKADTSFYLVTALGESSNRIERTADAVVASITALPGAATTGTFSITIAEANVTYTQEPGFVVVPFASERPSLRFLGMAPGASVVLPLALTGDYAPGTYTITAGEFGLVSIPVTLEGVEGTPVLVCSALSGSDNQVTIEAVDAGLLRGSFSLSVTDCTVRAFPSQQPLADATAPYSTLTVSGTFSGVPLPVAPAAAEATPEAGS